MEMTKEEVKMLPRLENEVFDLSGIGGDYYEAARYVYPMYAAYETECNKKEGYPDIMRQMRIIAEKLKEDYTFGHAASFLDMLIHTIDHMSLEIYEYYRELVDLFRENAKEVTSRYGTEDGRFQAEDANAETVNGNGKCVTLERLAKDAIHHACDTDVLLTEKYQVFF